MPKKRRGRVIERSGRFGARAYVLGSHQWCGTHDTEAQAWAAIDAELDRYENAKPLDCKVFAERWTTDYPRQKASTQQVNGERARAFARDFEGARMAGPLNKSAFARRNGLGNSPDRVVARRWALENPSVVTAIRAMFNDAVNDGLISTNPFAKLNLPQSRGRKDIVPPSVEEVELLAEKAREIHYAGSHGSYAAMLIFAAYTGVRPGELWELRWGDLDLKNLEMTVARRTFNGNIDLPKNGRRRTIVVPPPARDSLLEAPRRTDTDLLFTTKRGRPFSKTSSVFYWNSVRSGAGLPRMAFYELRHFCATHLLERGLPAHVVANQLGHTDGGRLVQTLYGHPSEVDARRQIKAAFDKPVELGIVRERKAANG